MSHHYFNPVSANCAQYKGEISTDDKRILQKYANAILLFKAFNIAVPFITVDRVATSELRELQTLAFAAKVFDVVTNQATLPTLTAFRDEISAINLRLEDLRRKESIQTFAMGFGEILDLSSDHMPYIPYEEKEKVWYEGIHRIAVLMAWVRAFPEAASYEHNRDVMACELAQRLGEERFKTICSRIITNVASSAEISRFEDMLAAATEEILDFPAGRNGGEQVQENCSTDEMEVNEQDSNSGKDNTPADDRENEDEDEEEEYPLTQEGVYPMPNLLGWLNKTYEPT